MRCYDKLAIKSTEKFSRNLDELARERARRMLKAALDREVEEFLGRTASYGNS